MNDKAKTKRCDRCDSGYNVQLDERCSICGSVWLCPTCYEFHKPGEL